MLENKRVIVPGDGTSLWTLTHSSDFAVGYTGLMGNVHAYNEAFYITGREVLTWNQIFETIADALSIPFLPCYVPSLFLVTAGEKYGYDYTGALFGDKSNSLVFDTSKIMRPVPEMNMTILFLRGCKEISRILLHTPGDAEGGQSVRHFLRQCYFRNG